MKVVPAAQRTPLLRGRHQLRITVDLALDLMDEGNFYASDLVLRNAEQMATSLVQHSVELGRETPTYMSGETVRQGGKGFSGTRLVDSAELVVPEIGATKRRAQGMRDQSLEGVTASNVKSMQTMILSQALTRIATTEGLSWSLSEIEGMPEWVAGHALNGEPPKMIDLHNELADRGYTVIDLSGAGTSRSMERMPKPSLKPGVGPRVPYGVDEAGTLRIRGVDSLGRPLENLDEFGAPVEGFDVNAPEFQGMEMRVMRSDMAAKLKDYLDPSKSKILRGTDQVTQLWKVATLAWSTTWTVYNLLGNIAMATFGAGMTPGELLYHGERLAREMKYASDNVAQTGTRNERVSLRRAARDEVLRQYAPPRLYAHGQAFAEVQQIGRLTDQAGVLDNLTDYISNRDRSLLGRFTDNMYQINELTDNFFRTTVFMNELSKRLPTLPVDMIDAKGNLLPDLDIDQQVRLAELNKEYHVEVEKSLKQTLNTMGDFTKLSPIERKLIKRVFPFWPWMRHQVLMSYRLPLNNPFRYALLASVSDQMLEEQSGPNLEGLMAGKTPTGDHLKNLFGFSDDNLVMSDWQGANPFLPIGSTPWGREPGSDTAGGTFFAPDQLLRSANPLATRLGTLAFGLDLTSAKETSRPLDQYGENQFGTNNATSALARVFGGLDTPIMERVHGLGEVGYNLMGAAPSTTRLRNLALNFADPGARYDSGDKVPYIQPPPGNWIYKISQAIGPPGLPRVYDRQRDIAMERDEALAGGS